MAIAVANPPETLRNFCAVKRKYDSLDSVEPRKTPEFLIDRITSKTDAELDGAIILMHVGIKSTADALPAIIANLQGRGFKLVTVSTLLESARKTH